MTRVEFTAKITMLLFLMIKEEEHPIGDWWLRTAEAQNALFKKGLSKCDGYEIQSKHQTGKALDIYFIEDGQMVDPKKGYEYWHDEWEKMGGQKMIEWDKGHWEG
jgi:hypothetical protein